MAHAQVVSPASYVDRRGAQSIADPCQDPFTPSALKEALRLVCLRERIEPANPRIQKAIIVGFVGGFVKSDDVKHPEVLFATYLQRRYGAAVHAEVFGNHHGKKAIEDTTLRLDTDKDGFLKAGEKEQVKIILFGHSWGASQTLIFRARTTSPRNPGVTHHPNRQREEVRTGRPHGSFQRGESSKFLSEKRSHPRAAAHRCSGCGANHNIG